MRIAAPLLIAAAAMLLCSCGSVDTEEVESHYSLRNTRPDALANPQAASAAVAAPTGPFAHWAAVIVAGDDEGAGGAGTTQAFDNARRDLAKAFVKAGFDPNHIEQFSTDPQADDPTHPGLSDIDAVKGGLQRLLGVAGEGCLIYITSHGNTLGIKVGDQLASTDDIAGLANKTCGNRPTVMILSACHSGIFIQPVSADNRMVMSAARADRSSFGCGTDSKYPFFDECMIESLPSAPNFPTLADSVKACVSRMETAEHFLPSEPQLSIGSTIGPELASMPFNEVRTAASQAASAACATNCTAPPKAAADAH